MLEPSRLPTESVERVGGLGLLLLSPGSNRYWIFYSKDDCISASLDVKSPLGAGGPTRARLLGLLLSLRFGAVVTLSFGLAATAFSSSASARSSSSSYP